MADSSKQITASIDALFSGIDKLVTTKTVVGDAVRVDGAIILPLMDVSCGMAAGAFDANAKNRGAGGMSAKMSPSAILVIQNGFSSGKVSIGGQISETAVQTAERMARDDGK